MKLKIIAQTLIKALAKKSLTPVVSFRMLPWIALSCFCLPLPISFAALANDPYTPILVDQQNGKYPEALSQIKALLVTNANDPQALLLKGNVTKLMGDINGAIVIFKDLIIKHPSLPEPYNNLAVLYADQGQSALAIETLQQVFSTSASYGTAYQNLRALYNHMASSAYRDALDIKQKPQPQSQYALLNRIDNVVSYVDAAIDPAPDNNQPVVAVSSSGNTVNAEKPAEQNDKTVEITAMISDWSNAWSDRKVKKYLAYYHQSFIPPSGLSRKKWEQNRYKYLNRPKFINIDIIGLSILEKGNDSAMVMFEQHYRSDTYSDTVVKQLELKKEPSGWQILKESVL